jgi:hypothetical protein
LLASSLPIVGPIRYVPPERTKLPFGRVIVAEAGARLKGVDCRDCFVTVHSNDVTVRECQFNATTAAALDLYADGTRLTVEYCEFDGERKGVNASPMLRARDGVMTVRHCVFQNLPGDGVMLIGGTVENCVFRGAGFNKALHADAVWVPKTIAPIVIARNNVDWRQPPGAEAPSNNAFRIVSEFGNIQDVLIEDNWARGGTYTVHVGAHQRVPQYHVSKVIVRDNLLADWLYGPLYPALVPSDLVFEGNRHLFTGQALRRR